MKPRLAAVACIALLPSCSLLITKPETQTHAPIRLGQNATTPLLVFSHGYHTGLTLPASALKRQLPALSSHLDNQWLEFGWGDEGFYRSEIITTKLVLQALCYPTPGVVHVASFNNSPRYQYQGSPLRVLELDSQDTQALATFLADSFAREEDGGLIDLGPGRYGNSTFFRAKKSYYFPRSCNSWTARGIRESGTRVHAITAPGVMRQLPEN